MKSFIFALIALLCWSGSDLFSKLSTSQKDKYSHWRVILFVGLIMGAHAIISIIVSGFLPPVPDGETPEWWRNLIYTDFKPINFVQYLPVAFIYLLAMVIGYAGLRYIELSVSSPICNASGSLALVICVLLGWAGLDTWSIIGVLLISVGIVLLGCIEYFENDEIKLKRQEKSNFKYTKSFVAIIIPFIYLILDALGTVGDQMIFELNLFELSEFASNTAFELSSLLFAIVAFIMLKFVKKVKVFDFKKNEETGSDGYRLLGGLSETIGQIFYMAVMFSDFDAGIPMISAYCVISVLWCRIFLKEKLTFWHYLAIFITVFGIILLGIFSPV